MLGAPVISSVRTIRINARIAAHLLGAPVCPLLLSNGLSTLFPAHVQAYYDVWVEPRTPMGSDTIDAAMRTVPLAAASCVMVAVDIVLAAGPVT